MDIPRPDGPDVNHGTNIFIGCWVLTGIVGVVLAFRLCFKAWMYWILPKVSTPERVWGYEDIFYLLGYAFDIAHITFIWKSWEWGLGRHFFYLSPIQRNRSLKWDFISQPLAVSAAMFSRTGVIVFLYTCFASNNKKLRGVVITCMVVQIVANLFTILQIFLQCGPNPYRLVNRAAYFHYMWDPLPEDGSVICQAPSVQATTGYVQGAFNCIIDFTLTYLSAFELWLFLVRTSSGGAQRSLISRFRKLDKTVRNQRLWQTLFLCGPLLLSGISSIVKTVLLSALGSRSDFTWNIVSFILWVKIENYCIPIATCGPILRLFARTYFDQRRENRAYGGNSYDRSHSKSANAFELSNRSARPQSGAVKTFLDMTVNDDIEESARCGSGHGSENHLVDNISADKIMVKQEYEIRVEDSHTV